MEQHLHSSVYIHGVHEKNSVFIRQKKLNKQGKVNWETANFGWTDVLLFGKQPIHQNAMKMEARDGQYGGMTLKPVNLKSQHVEVLLNPWKILQKSWLVQEDFEQKDNLSSFPQTWKTAAKDWGDSILFATGSPLVSRFSVIWSDIPAYNSNIRGTVRSILNSAKNSLPFHFCIAFSAQNGLLLRHQVWDRRLINSFGYTCMYTYLCIPIHIKSTPD